jgi:hypothetical protein
MTNCPSIDRTLQGLAMQQPWLADVRARTPTDDQVSRSPRSRYLLVKTTRIRLRRYNSSLSSQSLLPQLAAHNPQLTEPSRTTLVSTHDYRTNIPPSTTSRRPRDDTELVCLRRSRGAPRPLGGLAQSAGPRKTPILPTSTAACSTRYTTLLTLAVINYHFGVPVQQQRDALLAIATQPNYNLFVCLFVLY